MSHPIGVVITTRLGSSRIPAKPFIEIAGKRAMDIQLAFLKKAGFPIVAAIPPGLQDDPLAAAYEKAGVAVSRGYAGSPLHRMQEAAQDNQFDRVVRVTSDDLFIDPTLLSEQWDSHSARHAEYSFCVDSVQGGSAEIINREVLDRAAEKHTENVEFVSYAVRQESTRVLSFVPRSQYCYQFRLSLDWPEDLTALRVICNAMEASFPEGYDLVDMIHFLRSRKNWYIQKINRMPLVTVYTSNFNQARFVRETVDSVVRQDFSWEYLVYDDHSTDESAGLLLEWASGLPDEIKQKVRLFRNERNLGLPATCNLALARARGKYVIRIDSDDVMLDGALEKMVGMFRTLGDAAALFSGYARMDADGLPLGSYSDNEEEHPGMCMLLARAAHDVRYREGLEHYEGVEFLKRFKKRYQVAHIPDILWKYRLHSSSKSFVATPERIAIKQELEEAK